MGLSPLARGNRLRIWKSHVGHGPIPARAGQPGGATWTPSASGAYPRSRGATNFGCFCNLWPTGLSPLARGNPLVGSLLGGILGPIPARAGQPGCARSCRVVRRAYPRSRGATGKTRALRAGLWGLSPLARGNRGGIGSIRLDPGPIPARAGQPCWQRRPACRAWAYPRSRGATRHGPHGDV